MLISAMRSIRRAGPAVAWLLLPAPAHAQEARSYLVDAAASSILVQVGKAGLFKFAGHEHEVAAPALAGEIVRQPDLRRSSITLSVDATALKVTGRGEPPDDVPEVQATMLGPKVLEVTRFPTISFRSRAVGGRETGPGTYQVNVSGELTLHAVTRQVSIAGRVDEAGDVLTVTGEFPLRQTHYDIAPVSAAAGTVKVKDELTVRFKIVARASR
jgi:polyisoprenoid-binding protein YceI